MEISKSFRSVVYPLLLIAAGGISSTGCGKSPEEIQKEKELAQDAEYSKVSNELTMKMIGEGVSGKYERENYGNKKTITHVRFCRDAMKGTIYLETIDTIYPDSSYVTDEYFSSDNNKTPLIILPVESPEELRLVKNAMEYNCMQEEEILDENRIKIEDMIKTLQEKKNLPGWKTTFVDARDGFMILYKSDNLDQQITFEPALLRIHFRDRTEGGGSFNYDLLNQDNNYFIPPEFEYRKSAIFSDDFIQQFFPANK